MKKGALPDDGQFGHGRHAQIARRAILSHYFGIVEIGKSEIYSVPSCLDMRDVRPSSRYVGRVAMDAIGAQRRSARDASDKAVWSRHPDAGVKLAG
jgi:hypothetical protein